MKSLHITIDWRAIIEGDAWRRTEEYHIQLYIQVIGDEDNLPSKNNGNIFKSSDDAVHRMNESRHRVYMKRC